LLDQFHKAVSEKVLEANRMNAKKSTGPKSAGGKLAVRYNTVKHGLLAKQILFRHDEARQQAFDDFLDEIERDLMPVGPIERMLVEEICACWWKLQEATGLEFRETTGTLRSRSLSDFGSVLTPVC
jgi:hypothetical protein